MTNTTQSTYKQENPVAADNVNSVTTDTIPLADSATIQPEERAGTVTLPNPLAGHSFSPLGAGVPPGTGPTTAAVPMSQLKQPVLLKLDTDTWKVQIDRVEQWLHDLQTVQAAYRQLAHDTAATLHEVHLKAYVEDIYQAALKHEAQIDELYRIIGREPKGAFKTGGSLLGKSSEALAALLLGAGGAVGGWRELHQLFLYSLHAISAWSAAEQLGFALGIREYIDITFPIVQEKFTQHRLLQEITMETVTLSVLYRSDI